MNAERNHVNHWFCGNKLYLNNDKTKYVMFHQAKSKDDLSVVFPDLFINDVKTIHKGSH